MIFFISWKFLLIWNFSKKSFSFLFTKCFVFFLLSRNEKSQLFAGISTVNFRAKTKKLFPGTNNVIFFLDNKVCLKASSLNFSPEVCEASAVKFVAWSWRSCRRNNSSSWFGCSDEDISSQPEREVLVDVQIHCFLEHFKTFVVLLALQELLSGWMNFGISRWTIILSFFWFIFVFRKSKNQVPRRRHPNFHRINSSGEKQRNVVPSWFQSFCPNFKSTVS